MNDFTATHCCGHHRKIYPLKITNMARLPFLIATLFLCFAAQFVWPADASTPTEEKFTNLQVGTNKYRDVTVLTKARNYIYIVHSGGMTSIKISELPADILERLGYAMAPAPKAQKVTTAAVSAWAKRAVKQMEIPELKRMESKAMDAWGAART